MSRPEFLNCPMTPNIISHIRDEQECYDTDPDKYEREQEQYELQRQEEAQREYDDYQNHMINLAEQEQC